MNNEQRIKELETKVQELLAWKQAREAQQITFPLDKISKDIITENIPVWNGIIASAPPEYDGAIMSLNGKPLAFLVVATSVYE